MYSLTIIVYNIRDFFVNKIQPFFIVFCEHFFFKRTGDQVLNFLFLIGIEIRPKLQATATGRKTKSNFFILFRLSLYKSVADSIITSLCILVLNKQRIVFVKIARLKISQLQRLKSEL